MSRPALLLLALATLTLLLGTTVSSSPDSEHEFLVNSFNKRSLLYTRNPSTSRSRSSIIPWKYLARQESSSVESAESNESVVSQPQVQSEEESSPEVQQQQVVMVHQKGDSQPEPPVQSDEEEDEEPQSVEQETVNSPRDLITFSYYPIKQHSTPQGQVVYEIEDSDLRTSRQGWGWGKGKKKKCKKGKKGKKKGKGKGKKKGKKGCQIKGGWWYVWDKKHGYLAGRWGDPPPKGLEREHYHHNFGKLGHGYGTGYDGHGHMGWKVKGWGQHHGHGGHHGGGGFGGYGGGGFGGGGGGHHHGGWGWQPKVEYYGWGHAEKVKGWGWKR